MISKQALYATTALFCLTAGAAHAQESPASEPARTPGTVAPPVEEGGAEIVVTGVRRSLEDALNTKRNATEVVDSLSSEGVGKLPDLNLAEALQRVPGVQINRSALRRLGSVSIRGLPGGFVATQLNGQPLSSPNVTGFNFGAVRSEAFSRIDVIKAQGADRYSGGVAGVVDLRTGDPLSSRDSLTITVDNSYEELADGFAPGAAVALNQEILDDTLAVRIAGGWKRLNFRDDEVQINAYDRTAGAATPTDSSDDVLVPRQVRLNTNIATGDAYSLSGAVEYRPEPELTIRLGGFYSMYAPDIYNTNFAVESQAASSRTQSNPIDTDDFGRTFTSVRFDDPWVRVDSRELEDRFTTQAYNAEVAWDDGDWTVNAIGHFTRGDRSRETRFFYAVQNPLAGAASNGYSLLVDTGGGNIRDFTYDLIQPRTFVVDLQQPFSAPTLASPRSVNGLASVGQQFQAEGTDEEEGEKEYVARFDVGRRIEWGPLQAIKAGTFYRWAKQQQRFANTTLFGTNLAGLSNSAYDFSSIRGKTDFYYGQLGSFDPADRPEMDTKLLDRLLAPAPNLAALPNSYVGPYGYLYQRMPSLSFDNRQEIYGGYGMVELDGDLAPLLRLRGNAGVRYERTSRSTISAQQPPAINFSFDNWLPSVNLALEYDDQLILRGSYTHTMRRPEVDSFAVGNGRSFASNSVQISLGANELRPFISKNIDLGIEWYNRSGSVLSASYFHKKVTDYAAAQVLCPEDGGSFGFGPLSNVSGLCRTTTPRGADGLFPDLPVGTLVAISQIANQDEFTLKGFEVTAQQNLDFLPAPWDGFGGQMNYTNVQFETESTFRISEISRHTVNAILYYETPRFGVRAAYNYRSGYFLASGGTFTGADRLVEPRPQLDLSGQFNVSDKLTFTAEAFNVTNEDLIEYEGTSERVRSYRSFGRTYTLGARYSF
ncbi:hypothetical protein PK98_04030 [Croceibacterium mercuriale]|uniref:TonB-dependent receptor n=1 Tax=Croceibacterium mercuriale TaxID=1572751 RepID=A0A0B2C0V8_9SPHN|nr:TonB-dependent receptor [Croceibacterium mercuriale]KHL25790.1 hypothetical protein PK98_04030 [Croceibacterium mercuriale]